MKTPNTSEILSRTVDLIDRYKIPHENCLIDRGGGGKQHADYMREKGYNVRTVAFGEPASDPNRVRRIRMRQPIVERVDNEETRSTYKNRRAEMYGELRIMLDPINEIGFGIPAEMIELRRQLAIFPLKYDEGKLYLPPKDKKNDDSTVECLRDILGCSPDEADSLVLAVFGLLKHLPKRTVGAI